MTNKIKNMRYFQWLILVLFCSCGNKTEKEIYLIPNHFEGKVNVLFDQSKGEAAVYEKESRIYKIPADGILMTKFVVQEGLIKREYYTYDEKDHRELLNITRKEDDFKNNKKYVFRDGTIGVLGDSKGKNAVVYQEFYITTAKRFQEYFADDSIKSFEKKVNDKISKLKQK